MGLLHPTITKKHMKYYCFIFIFVCICTSCSFNKQEQDIHIKKNTYKLNGHIVNSSLMMSIGRDIQIYDNCLVIRTFSDNKFLYILNKKNGEIIACLVPQGNGPNESTEMSDQIQIDKNGNLSWFDYDKKKLFTCNLNAIINNSANYTNIHFKEYSGNIDLILGLNKNKYLVSLEDIFSESNKIKRYAIFDSTKINSTYLGFPVIKNSLRNLNETYLNYRISQHLALAANQQKFAVAETYGGILEIFQIADSIKLNSIHPFSEYKKTNYMDLLIYIQQNLTFTL